MVADEENKVEGNVVGNISLRYHGPALDRDHTMSARTLAPALLNFADAIDAAKDELAPKAKVELRVLATKTGSFDIQFILTSLGDLATSSQGQGIQWLSDVLGVGFVSIVIGAFKALKFRHDKGKTKIVDTKPVNDDIVFSEERVTIESADGERIETYKSSLRIADNSKFVNNAGKALSGPSSQKGVDGAEVSSGKESVDIDKKTAQSMAEWVPAEDVINESDVKLVVQPLDAHFEPGKKWHVTTGNDVRYTVDMEDEAFIHAVEDGERIGKKDTFLVNLHTVSTMGKDGKLKGRYSITKVFRHKPYEPKQDEFRF